VVKGTDCGEPRGRFTIESRRTPIVFYAFDLLRLNGKNLQSLPIEERKAKLEELLKKPPGVIRYSVSFTKDLGELLSRTRELGLEGLIGKRSGSRYEPGKRTGAWVKLKLHQEQEFVIGGYTEPEGSRKYFGALLVGFYEGKKPRPEPLGPRFDCCRNETLPLGQTDDGLPDKIHRTDAG
jgi:bifunctional non-homologous end joining protein LigD